MATRYAVASGDWSDSANVWSDSEDGSPGAYVPIDGDAAVIQDGVNVKVDVDQSAWTGLQGITIQGGDPPGMLYFSNGDDGYLKTRNTYDIVGTSGTYRGRILANSDGSWGTSTPLQFTNKATIEVAGDSEFDCQYLDIKLHATHPTNLFVTCYGTKYDFNAATAVSVANNTIDLGTTPPAEGTDVIIKAGAGATLPTPLSELQVYYIRNVNGNLCELATYNSDTMVVDITAVGSGTCSLLTEQASSTTTLNVFEDVTSDTPWITTSGHNRVRLVDFLSRDSDHQATTMATINASSIIIGDSVDSSQFAGARLFLIDRNVKILYADSTTWKNAFNYGGDSHGGVFDCAILCTYHAVNSYAVAINAGEDHTITSVISGFSYGISGIKNSTISAVILSGQPLNNCTDCTIDTAILMGTQYAVNTCHGLTFTSNSLIGGSNYAFLSCSNIIEGGTITGCGSAYGYSVKCITTSTGKIINCQYCFNVTSFNYLYGVAEGCERFARLSGNTIVHGTVVRMYYVVYTPNGDVTVLRGGESEESFDAKNDAGNYSKLLFEDYGSIVGATKVLGTFGDIYSTACDGTGDAPSEDPDGGSGDCIEASNIQSNCNTVSTVDIFENHSVWLTAGSHTITYKVQTTYSSLSAGGLVLTANYISSDYGISEETEDSTAIATRLSDADWTQSIAVTITTALAGWVKLKLELTQYESGDELYVWPEPIIT